MTLRVFCRMSQGVSHEAPVRRYQYLNGSALSSHDHEGRCAVKFQASYAPDRPEIVYCEQCYQAETV
ncbi:MAG: hypothetical protein Q8P56_05975 [Candidatus Uhrbacteria bacterium]|nr:hypothetical protein [Candidatus Uhrbacteria bacterium]